MKALSILRQLLAGHALPSEKLLDKAIEELKTLQSNYEAQEIIIADLKLQKSNLDRLLDQATYSLRCEELMVADLKKQLEPKTCGSCRHIGNDYGTTVCLGNIPRQMLVLPNMYCDKYEPMEV